MPSHDFHFGRGLLRGALGGPFAGPSMLLAGLLSSYAPSILTRRSRGVTPSSVSPEYLGDSKSRTGTRVRLCVVCMHGSTAGRWQSSGHDKTSLEGF